jgi:phospholipid transport system transporter-binding protein
MKLPASLTVSNADEWLQTLTQSLAQQPRTALWRIDAAALCEFDSATLALMLAVQRRAQAAGQLLQWQSLPGALLDLAQLYGVAALIRTPSPSESNPS